MEILNYKDTKIGLFYFLKNNTTTNITFFYLWNGKKIRNEIDF